ncbi:MAG TPA: YfhO family protein [Gaiellaceae bacterium]|nr:YfhO family protein [Gaiellaceae bacterium]
MAAGATRGSWRGDLCYLVAIAAAVVVANLPYLAGLADPNPLGLRSGLASSVRTGPLPGERSLDPNDGFTSQALGHRAALDVLELKAPWWNPYEGTGAPLAGEMQSAALFPPTLLLASSNGQLYEHMLLELVAGLCTYLLLRRLTVVRWASAAAGMAFALNGTFAWFSHAPANAVAFLPMLLLGIELAYTAVTERRRGGFALIAIAGALSAYAGFPEVAYGDSLLAVCWFAWRGACVGRAGLAAFAGKGAAGVVVGTLLAAPILVASADYVSNASLGGQGEAGAIHLPGAAAAQLALPYVYGPLFAFSDPKLVVFGVWSSVGGFLSVSLILFALVGLATGKHRGLRLALAAWLVLALSRMFGEPPGLGHVLGVVPGMSWVAFYRYGFPSLEFAVIVLAALGLDRIGSARLSWRTVSWTAGTALALVALAALEALPYARKLGSGSEQIRYLEASAVWGLAVVLVAAVAMALPTARLRAVVASAVVIAEALLLFAVPEASAPRSVAIDTAPAAYLHRHLGDARFLTLGPLQPDYGSYYGVASLNVNDVPVPSAFARYVSTRLDQAVDPTVFVGNLGGGRPSAAPSPEAELLRNLAAYRAAGVAYVLAPAGQTLPSGFTLRLRSPTTWIYQLAGADPLVTAPGCTLAGTADSLQLSCERPTLLVRRETALPGWHATIDGHPARLQTVDGLFQALPLARGSHRIAFSYAPPYLRWAFAGFVLGWAILGLGVIHSRRKGPVGGPVGP